MLIIATYGKYLADQIPQGNLEPRQPLPKYQGAATTDQILSDFKAAMVEHRVIHPSVKAAQLPRTPAFDGLPAMYKEMNDDDISPTLSSYAFF